MKVTVVVGPDGKLSAFIDKAEGDFQAGSKKLLEMLKALSLEGIDLEAGAVEQHTHEVMTVGNSITVSGDHSHE